PGRPATGLDLVRRAAKTLDRPWFAIGGIDLTTLPEVVGAGATRIVVVRAVTEAPDPAAAVRALLACLPEL
ncbi:MAG: thiamine phosphate synthase, partial [Actinobacteria bacterium]|nr:thiamine phosphate synthase [Actinomycetota bacterium]